MYYDPPLVRARLLGRRKRFFADVVLDTGQEVVAHCPNTGSMRHCLEMGTPCWVAPVVSPTARLPYRLELVTTRHAGLAGINTLRANALVGEVLAQGAIPGLEDDVEWRTEVPYGREKSRIDWLLDGPEGKCYLEVKNVTLADEGGIARFPDAVTRRGQKHLRELADICRQGHRAVLFYCVQIERVERMALAADIDPDYADAVQQAMAAGVEVLAWQATIQPPTEVRLYRPLPFNPDIH